MENVDYEKRVSEMAEEVFGALKDRTSPEDMERVRQAFLLAKEAHAPQRRKSGEPYIIHPVSVALIAAKELCLDANSVITAFLHDVVEDTPYTVEDIRERFGDDVAGLVDVVTKKKKQTYETTKQVDNYQQILASLHYDIRAVMVKISDRLHNMRTLESMRPDKQMKIAGETDCFYAPLANRLGLYYVKSDLENLSFRYRCEYIYGDLVRCIEEDKRLNQKRIDAFVKDVHGTLRDHGILCRVECIWRRPYSLWRRMQAQQLDYWHLPNRYYIRITFWGDTMEDALTDKQTCLKAYGLLTRDFRERPGSFRNQIDQAKENSYQCVKVMLLSQTGIWEDVQICSEEMVKASQVGCIGELGSNIGNWMKRFRRVLKDIDNLGNGDQFLENISSSLYYDDITVFSPDGKSLILPKDSTVIDYAFKQGEKQGSHAHYARVNGRLSSVKTVLQNGDCVELHTSLFSHPYHDWLDHCQTYVAKRYLRLYIEHRCELKGGVTRCRLCKPLPGGEVIGIVVPQCELQEGCDQSKRHIILHRRSCQEAIRMASKYGDNVISVNYADDQNAPSVVENTKTSITINRNGYAYPVTLHITAVDRYHLLTDLVTTISDQLHLSIDNLHTTTRDCLVDCSVTFLVHSVQEMLSAINRIGLVDGVDSVKQTEE